MLGECGGPLGRLDDDGSGSDVVERGVSSRRRDLENDAVTNCVSRCIVPRRLLLFYCLLRLVHSARTEVD